MRTMWTFGLGALWAPKPKWAMRSACRCVGAAFQAKCVPFLVPQLCKADMMLLSWAGQRAVVMHDSEEMRVWCRVRGSQPRLLRFILMHMLHEILHLHVPCLDTSKVEVGVSCHACGAPSSPFLGVAKKKAAAGKSYQCFMCDQVLDVQDLVDPPVEWKTMARQFFAGMGPSRPLPPAAASASASTHVPLH